MQQCFNRKVHPFFWCWFKGNCMDQLNTHLVSSRILSILHDPQYLTAQPLKQPRIADTSCGAGEPANQICLVAATIAYVILVLPPGLYLHSCSLRHDPVCTILLPSLCFTSSYTTILSGTSFRSVRAYVANLGGEARVFPNAGLCLRFC